MAGQQYAPGGQITFQDLLDLQYKNQFPDTVEAWDRLVGGIEVSAADLTTHVQTPVQDPQTWSGVAQQLAHDSISTTKDGLQGSKAQIANIAAELKSFYSQLEKLSQELSAFLRNPDLPTYPYPPNFVAFVPDNLLRYYKVSSDGTVDLAEDYRILRHQTNPSYADILKWQNTFQEDIQSFVTQANVLDQAAAAELMKNMPKAATTTNVPAPSTHMGGSTVAVKPFPDPTGSLWGIAQKEYGNGNYWPLIFEANKSKFGGSWGPNDIQEGWNIDVPVIKRGTPIPAPPANSSSTA
jgi:hypothetical protein